MSKTPYQKVREAILGAPEVPTAGTRMPFKDFEKLDAKARARATLFYAIPEAGALPDYSFFTVRRAAHGVPAEVIQRVRQTMPTPDKKTLAELQAIQADMDRIFAEMNRIASKRPSELQAEAHAELGRRILSGESLDGAHGWSLDDECEDQQSKLEALKRLLLQKTLRVHALLKPIFEAGRDAAIKLVHAELDAEYSRHVAFGLGEHYEASEILRSIAEAGQNFEHAAKTVPSWFSFPRDLCRGLVDL